MDAACNRAADEQNANNSNDRFIVTRIISQKLETVTSSRYPNLTQWAFKEHALTNHSGTPSEPLLAGTEMGLRTPLEFVHQLHHSVDDVDRIHARIDKRLVNRQVADVINRNSRSVDDHLE